MGRASPLTEDATGIRAGRCVDCVMTGGANGAPAKLSDTPDIGGP
jgi:hypothetical protein